MEIFLPIGYKFCIGYEIINQVCNTEFSNIYVVRNKNKEYIIKEYFPKKLVLRDKKGVIFTEKNKKKFEKYSKKFKNEIKILKKLKDKKGIIKIINNFECNDSEYIVMEKFNGVTLKEFILNEVNLKYNEIIKIFIKILKIIKKIHNEKILHLDINPKNILINDKKDIKIIDFGSSQKEDKLKNEEIIVFDGYSALEMYNRTIKKGKETDIYSIFSILYFMLFKKKIENSYNRFLEDTIFENEKINIEIKNKSELVKILKKGLEINKNKRYRNIDEILEELEKIRGKNGIIF